MNCTTLTTILAQLIQVDPKNIIIFSAKCKSAAGGYQNKLLKKSKFV